MCVCYIGDDAVHENCPQRPHKEIVICKIYRQSPVESPDIKNIIVVTLTFLCALLTEIQTIEGGQKDVLLRRTNIKKKCSSTM